MKLFEFGILLDFSLFLYFSDKKSFKIEYHNGAAMTCNGKLQPIKTEISFKCEPKEMWNGTLKTKAPFQGGAKAKVASIIFDIKNCMVSQGANVCLSLVCPLQPVPLCCHYTKFVVSSRSRYLARSHVCPDNSCERRLEISYVCTIAHMYTMWKLVFYSCVGFVSSSGCANGRINWLTCI